MSSALRGTALRAAMMYTVALGCGQRVQMASHCIILGGAMKKDEATPRQVGVASLWGVASSWLLVMLTHHAVSCWRRYARTRTWGTPSDGSQPQAILLVM